MDKRQFRAACSAYRKQRRIANAISMTAESAPSQTYLAERAQAKADIAKLAIVERPRGFDEPQAMIYGTSIPRDLYDLGALRRAVIVAKRSLARALKPHPLTHVSTGERVTRREALAVARVRHRAFVARLFGHNEHHVPGAAHEGRRASDRRLAA